MANEKTVTVWGLLSFPQWTAQAAFDNSQKGSYPAKSVAEAAPNFMLLLNDTQWEKFKKHCVEVFLPYCAEQYSKGEKRDALSPADVAKLLEAIEDVESATLNTPAKVIGDKTAVLAPDAVAAIKCIGGKGVDLELKAIVNSEAELSVPDPDILTFPVVKPIGATVHNMYAGCKVAATVNLYAYLNGKHPGFSAGVSVAVFKGEGTPFGGSIGVDDSEIFMD